MNTVYIAIFSAVASSAVPSSGWPNTFVQRAGECKSWNLIPLFGLAFSGDLRADRRNTLMQL